MIPEQAGRMIARNLDSVMQNLTGHGQHSEHVILRGIWRDGEPMKMQVRHIHAGIHGASLLGLGRKIVAVGDFEDVTWRSTDHRRRALTVERKRIPAVFIHCVQRERHNVILRSHLRRFRQGSTLGRTQS